MANPEHVAKLKEGVEAWNKWREEKIEIEVDLSEAILNHTDLKGTFLFEANLSGANLIEAQMSGTNLNGANLSGANLSGADLSEAKLDYTDLSAANLSGANLSGAVLADAQMSGAFLSEANLTGAYLSRADLDKANLSGANLSGAYLGYAILVETVIADVDLSNAEGLEEIEHWGPSIIDHRTIALSGELPNVFLRGIGLQNWQIEDAKLLQPGLSNAEINDIIYRVYDLRAHQAIQISPLFISYSHTNTLFVDALEKKLIARGVRFWRDIHDMKAGKMEKQVDRAMRLNDTVLKAADGYSPADMSNLVRRVLPKIRKIAKLRSVGIHGLRHSYCVMLIKAGVPVAAIQKELGHKSIATTEGYAQMLTSERMEITYRAFERGK